MKEGEQGRRWEKEREERWEGGWERQQHSIAKGPQIQKAEE